MTRNIVASALALLCIPFLVRFDLHTDDTGVLVFLMLATGFLLGAIQPRYAWAWGLLLGGSIILAEWYNAVFLTPRPSMQSFWSSALVALFVLSISMAGAYAGALIRKVFPQ
jgi:hypothetical protein